MVIRPASVAVSAAAMLTPATRTCIQQSKVKCKLDDFVGAKFYCPHAFADGNQHIRITEKMLEFSSTVLSTQSLYPISKQ